jgi:hypothetical protein
VFPFIWQTNQLSDLNHLEDIKKDNKNSEKNSEQHQHPDRQQVFFETP